MTYSPIHLGIRYDTGYGVQISN